MNQARQAFERFEKSDSWLPVILLSLVGVGGTIGIVTFAANLGQGNLHIAKSLFFNSGKLFGLGLIHHTDGRLLGDDDVSQVEIDGLAEVEGWGDGFTYVAAMDWTPKWVDAMASEMSTVQHDSSGQLADELRLTDYKALCWISDDGLSLLVIILSTDFDENHQPIGSKIGNVQLLSIEADSDKYLITAEKEPSPEAPWESKVSMDLERKVKPQEIFAKHQEHIGGKALKKIPMDRLHKFMLESLQRKAFWLISRGGLLDEELDPYLAQVLGGTSDLDSSLVLMPMKLGLLAGISEQATAYALEAYAGAELQENLIAIHPCSHYTELARTFDLVELADVAMIEGPRLKAKTDELIQRIESEGLATLIHEMDQPFEAKIYKLNEVQEQDK